MKYNDMIKRVKLLMPLLEEAAKHNERGRVVDLAQEIIKCIDSYIVLPLAPEVVVGHLDRIKRHVKSYLIKSAYKSETEEGIEELLQDQEMLIEKARGVIQANTNGNPSRGIRDVTSRTEHFSEDYEGMSTTEVEGPHNPDQGLSNPDQGLSSPASGSRHPAFDSRSPAQNTGDSVENILDIPSDVCDNSAIDAPFKIEDFAMRAQVKRELTYADLIDQVNKLIREVEG